MVVPTKFKQAVLEIQYGFLCPSIQSVDVVYITCLRMCTMAISNNFHQKGDHYTKENFLSLIHIT